MGYNMAGGTSNMLKSGHTSASGLEEAVMKNIEAGKVREMSLQGAGYAWRRGRTWRQDGAAAAPPGLFAFPYFSLFHPRCSQKLAQMVASSMGPNGMNKLVVNHLNKIIVTSDCATLVKEVTARSGWGARSSCFWVDSLFSETRTCYR
jgi:hypothetical protein